MRQFGSELLDCDPPPSARGSTKLVVTDRDTVSLADRGTGSRFSLGVAGVIGCKLSRYLVLRKLWMCLQQPFHALC